jgi:bifunctional DNA-binding transcriptional regulator/antitoxin component of YhaV-PrlF toxin-antitoxin module
MDTTVLSSRGQVVIPLQVRRIFGAGIGERLTVSISEDGQEVRLRRQESVAEISARLSKFGRQDADPLLDVRGYYQTRDARL